MGLLPKKRISKNLGHKIILDTCPWSGCGLEYNSVMCKIPFTKYKLMWMDKRVPSSGSMDQRFDRDEVQWIVDNTNLVPGYILYEHDEQGCPVSEENVFLETDEDWNKSYPENLITCECFFADGKTYASTFDFCKHLFDTYQIVEFTTLNGGKVCNIGKSLDEKWYGWSHRAIYGYGIGDTVPENDPDSDWPDYWEHQRFCLTPGKVIETDREAQLCAAMFAESVG